MFHTRRLKNVLLPVLPQCELVMPGRFTEICGGTSKGETGEGESGGADIQMEEPTDRLWS